MANLTIKISHHLSEDQALKRIKNLLKKVKKEFADKVSDLDESWDGSTGHFSFNAMGFAVSGQLVVRSSNVEINANLPFAASLFKGKIESVIREQAKTLLA